MIKLVVEIFAHNNISPFLARQLLSVIHPRDTMLTHSVGLRLDINGVETPWLVLHMFHINFVDICHFWSLYLSNIGKTVKLHTEPPPNNDLVFEQF